ncbi:MAG TPA: hypothetical protein VLA04_01640 [Verrucomicrobiae bacterium]|nr:hypothetical protein [Verrucomicrobiae bacterium]
MFKFDIPATATQRNIAAGPDKFTLWTVCGAGDGSKHVTLRVQSPEKIDSLEVSVHGLMMESGGGNNWIMCGWIDAINGNKLPKSLPYNAYYTTHNRQGFIRY